MQTQTTVGANDAGEREKGFFRSLFDLSFRHFVTGRVVSFLYVVSLIFVSLNTLFSAGYFSVLLGVFLTTVYSQALGWVAGIALFLLVAPILLFVSVVYVRVLLEIVMVLLRIAENTAALADRAVPDAEPAGAGR